MATQKLHFRPLFLVVFTLLLLISVTLTSMTNIQAQEGVLPLPGSVNGRDFTEVQVLEPPAGFLEYGYSVAAEGDLLAFGAILDDSAETRVVLIFRRNNSGVWVHEETLTLPESVDGETGEPSGYFGSSSHAISGNTLMVGYTCATRGVFEPECFGAVYFF